jgi:hypothetical protein
MAQRKSREKRGQDCRPLGSSVRGEQPPQVMFPRRFRPPRSLIFFVLFYGYFAWGIDVRLLYYSGGLVDNFPSFYRGWDFFSGFLTVPGGPLEYVTALLAQSFYYSWLGAAVMTAQAWGFAACTECAVTTFGVPSVRGLRFLAPLLLLAVYSRYGFPFLTTMGLLAAWLGACLYWKFGSAGVARTLGLYLPLSVLLYVAAGGCSLVFVILCGLYELLIRRRFGLGLTELAVGATVPYVLGVLAYGVPPLDAYTRLLPLAWEVWRYSASRTMSKAVGILYLFLPALLILSGLCRFARQHRENHAALTTKPGRPVRVSSRWQAIRTRAAVAFHDQGQRTLGWDLPTLALVGLVAATVLLCRDPATKRIQRADYFSHQGQWAQVLEVGRHGPCLYSVCHAVNRALCRLDRLGDDMFSFPQDPAALLLTNRSAAPFWQKFDTCLDLGMINQAQHALVVCTDVYGPRPLLLYRLATIHRIKGNVAVARVFLEALAQVPFWRSVAHRDLTRLENDPNLSADPEIQHWRSVMLKRDSVRDADTLSQLLLENPGNRVAYQYAMASLLLARNLDRFVQMFDTYHRRNFSRVPRHYEEALLLSERRGKPVAEASGQVVSPEARARFEEFLRIFQQAGGQAPAARAALREKFGSTYFYYYFFGST